MSDTAPPISGVTTQRTRKFVDVAWVEEGMSVWLRWSHDLATHMDKYVRCTVAVAAGNHARIVNESRGLDTWKPIDHLSVEEGDPHSYAVSVDFLRE